jgi:hypothetical protein
MNPTKAHLEIMLHSLGISDPYQKESYRNYFVAGPGHYDLPLIMDLIGAEMMEERRAPGFLEGGDRVFGVTDKGKLYCNINREKPSKAKRTYRMYLECSDCNPDLTFREFLTDPYFKEARESA